MTLDGIMSFLRLKDVINTCKVCDVHVVSVLTGVLQCNGGTFEVAKDSK